VHGRLDVTQDGAAGGGGDDPVYAQLTAELEEVEAADDVGLEVVRGVGDALDDPGVGRQMDHGVLTLHRRAQLVTVAEVARDETHPVEVQMLAVTKGLVVDHGDGDIPSTGEVVGQVPADESCATGDQDVLHQYSLDLG
jgi:hypothetical protein